MDQLEGISLEEMIILKRMLKKELCRGELDSCGSRRDPVAGPCENINKTSCSKGGRKYLQWLTDYQLLCSKQLGSVSDVL